MGIVVTAGAWFVVAQGRFAPQPPARRRGRVPDSFDAAEFGSYLWQYYLPRLPFQTVYPGLEAPRPRLYDVWLKESVGAFGWLEVRWPPNVYRAAALLSLLVIGLFFLAVHRRRRTLDRTVLIFFAGSVFTVMAGLHWNEYKLAEEHGALINQGRYLFPMVGLAGLVCAGALTVVAPRRRPLALATFLAALAVLELFSLGNVAARFYA